MVGHISLVVLKSKIDNYELINPATHKIESPVESNTRTFSLLQNNITELYSGASRDDRKEARELFLYILEFRANELKEANFNKEETDFTKRSIDLESILGAEGVELYKAAIAEEENSVNFRNAVFLSAIKHYPGERWRDRLILWIGGPSASGKSSIADVLIRKVGLEVMQYSRSTQGNNVVLIDGSIERQVSQMRKLVLQVALKKGYSGITDLHENTTFNLKGIILEAVLSRSDLNLVIPETFANLKTYISLISLMKHFSIMPNTKQIYSFIEAEKNQEDRFQRSVKMFGALRAFSRHYDVNTAITINNLNINCESKKYDPGVWNSNFYAGIQMSSIARTDYEKMTEDPVCVTITNDMMVVVKKRGDWVEMQSSDYNPIAKIISARDFARWRKFKENNADADFLVWLDRYKPSSHLVNISIAPRPVLEIEMQEFKPRNMINPDTKYNSFSEVKSDNPALPIMIQVVNQTNTEQQLNEPLLIKTNLTNVKITQDFEQDHSQSSPTFRKH